MTVFANGLEVACKAQSNKVIAAFPYVCMTPPQTPATPPGVPVPYPTFGMDGDTEKGTGTVKIGGETVTQKNKSYYTKCTGNEAGCAPMKNVITHVNTGKEYAHAWSGDVKMDGEPVSRFPDLSTNDHASPQAGGGPSGKVGGAGGASSGEPECIVGTYKEIKDRCSKKSKETGIPHQRHHIIPDRVYRCEAQGQASARMDGAPSYNDGINICLPRPQHKGAAEQHPEAAHANLDNALEKFGRALNPPDVAKIGEIRVECLFALRKLIPKYITMACFELCVEKLVEQTADIEDMHGRTKIRQLDKNSPAQQLMKSQKAPG